MVANTICYLIEFNKEGHLEVLEEIMLEDSEKLFNYLMHFLERKITALHNIIDEVHQRCNSHQLGDSTFKSGAINSMRE